MRSRRNETKTVAILSSSKDKAQAIKEKLPELFGDAADKRKALQSSFSSASRTSHLLRGSMTGWSDEKKKQVLQVFTNNMIKLKSPPENADINLF